MAKRFSATSQQAGSQQSKQAAAIASAWRRGANGEAAAGVPA